MSETITLHLPDILVAQARSVAQRTQRDVETVLLEWLDRGATDMPVDLLPDADVLALSTQQMDERQQRELSDLLAQQREGSIPPGQRERLDALLQVYRRGLVRKAQAMKVAVERGLQAPLR
jgi:hypothetical protein